MRSSFLWAFLMPIISLADSLVADYSQKSFKIDYANNRFLKDGRPFQYVSGSNHYFRSTEEQWDDLLRKCRLGGLNTISTYIPWNIHQETAELDFNYNGNRNLFKYLDLAKKNDLLVILRPGPYVNSERNMGGLPPWLLWTAPGIKLRSSDPAFLYYITRWFDELLPKLWPYLYENGGPVITMQVENEYGSSGCDKAYTSYLRDLMRRHLGPNLVLFTTDGPLDKLLKCGSIEGVYATVDFGPESPSEMNSSFAVMRKYSPKGPLVNSEFYSGWIDHWQTPHSVTSAEVVAKALDFLLGQGANVNIYVYHGGANFGFEQGATVDDGMYNPITTSYDFDAPLTEAGDPTDKYFAIKAVIQKYMAVPSENPITSSKLAPGRVYLKKLISIHSKSFLPLFGKQPQISTIPLFYKDLHQSTGFVVYQTTVPFVTSDPVLLNATGIRDRGYIFANHIFQGIISRQEGIYTQSIRVKQNDTLAIFVEDQGRVCFGDDLGESIGLGENVTLGEKQLLNWTNIAINGLNNYSLELQDKTFPSPTPAETLIDIRNGGGGIIYVGNFTVEKGKKILDTFIRLDGFSKGVVWINGFNLGRYWPVGGPQVTLFLPGSLLKPDPEVNQFVVFELENSPNSCYVPQQLTKLEFQRNCYISLTHKPELNSATAFKSPKRPFNAMLR